MLTRDENIVNVRLAVQYQIHNAKDYLFNVKHNEPTLKQLTQSVERAVIGRNNMDFILTEAAAKSSQKSNARFRRRWTTIMPASPLPASTYRMPATGRSARRLRRCNSRPRGQAAPDQ